MLRSLLVAVVVAVAVVLAVFVSAQCSKVRKAIRRVCGSAARVACCRYVVRCLLARRAKGHTEQRSCNVCLLNAA